MGEMLSVKKPRTACRMIESLRDEVPLPKSFQKDKPDLTVNLSHAQTSFSVNYAVRLGTMMMYLVRLISKSHERTGSSNCQCVVSDFEYDGHIHRHIYLAPGEIGTWQVVPGEDDS